MADDYQVWVGVSKVDAAGVELQYWPIDGPISVKDALLARELALLVHKQARKKARKLQLATEPSRKFEAPVTPR